MICFTISGIFKEAATSLIDAEIVLGFCRTFVLKSVSTHIGTFNNSTQYQIINESVNIRNLMGSEMMSKYSTYNNKWLNSDTELTNIEKKVMVQIFEDLTNIKTEYCYKTLEKYGWVLQDAIETFIKLYEEDKIPKQGFN